MGFSIMTIVAVALLFVSGAIVGNQNVLGFVGDWRTPHFITSHPIVRTGPFYTTTQFKHGYIYGGTTMKQRDPTYFHPPDLNPCTNPNAPGNCY